MSLKFNPFLDLAAYAGHALKARKLGFYHRWGGAPQLGPAGGPHLDLLHAGWGSTSPKCASIMGCASARSRPIGAA